MIIRVFRMRAKPGRDAELERHVREHAIPLIRHHRGLLSFWTGRSGADFLAVSSGVWDYAGAPAAAVKAFNALFAR